MNSKQYIPASINPFDCDYYGKDFPYNQNIGEHRFKQSEGKSFSEYRHSQPANMNSGQFMPSEGNSYPCGVYGFNFSQNQNMNEHRLAHSNVLQLGEPRNSHAINMATEPYTSRAVNYTVNDVSGTNYTQQQHSVIPSEVHPVGSDPCDSRPARKEKQTRERTFVCEVCGRGFFEMSSLTVHSRLHSGERPFPCEVCDKAFASREGLRSHLVVHSEARPFPCDLCDKKFARKQQMQHHRLIHSNERPYVCQVCQKGFKVPKLLKVHMRAHSEERPYACDQCDKKFKSMPEVNRHKKLHNAPEKPFACEFCTMRFLTRTHLKKHHRVHTGEKPYHCPLCPTRMANKQSFLKHVRSHGEEMFLETVDINPNASSDGKNPTGPHCTTRIPYCTKKVYMCVTCREEFLEQCELEKHQLHHKREKPFACFLCRVRFFRSSNLKLHLSVIHYSQVTQIDSQGENSLKSGLLPCEMCEKSFRSRRNLERHILFHLSQQNSGQRMFPIKQGEFPCDQCGKRFTCQKNLRTHALVHSKKKKKPHQCVVCSKKFINRSLLRKHTRIHTENSYYICHFCNTQYTRRDSLVRHFREHLNEQSYLQMTEMISEKDKRDEDSNISSDDAAGNDSDENQLLERKIPCGRKSEQALMKQRRLKSAITRQSVSRVTRSSEHSQVDSQSSPKNTQGEFACDQCGKTFDKRRYLYRHIRLHSTSREKPYQCTVCSKSFTRRTYLESHAIVHTKEKSHVCKICHRRYKRKNSLVKHFRAQHGNFEMTGMSSDQDTADEELPDSHVDSQSSPKNTRSKFAGDQFRKTIDTRKNPYECTVCSKRFKDRYHLRRHTAVHTTKKPHVCKICHKGYASKDALARHFREQHSTAQMAENSSDQDASDEELSDLHSQVDSQSSLKNTEGEFACDQLSKTFDMRKNPHQCTVCSKRFKDRYHLTRHTAVHTAKKPHICKICHKGYASKDALSRHFRAQHNLQVAEKSSDQDASDKEQHHRNLQMAENNSDRDASDKEHSNLQMAEKGSDQDASDKEHRRNLQMAEKNSDRDSLDKEHSNLQKTEMSCDQDTSDEEDISLAVLTEKLFEAKTKDPISKDV